MDKEDFAPGVLIGALGVLLFVISLLMLIGLAMTKSPETIHAIRYWSGMIRVFGLIYFIDAVIIWWDDDNNICDISCSFNQSLGNSMNFFGITILTSLIYIIIHYHPIIDRLSSFISFPIIGLSILCLVSIGLSRFVYMELLFKKGSRRRRRY